MKLIYEKGAPGRHASLLGKCDVPEVMPPVGDMRKEKPLLPEVSETEISRHYQALSKRAYGVCDGLYPLGSCTMKYNPSVDEDIAALPEFTAVHPLAPDETVQGSLTVLSEMEKVLMAITGFAGFTFEPAAGAHGEFTGLLTIKAYHRANGDLATRTKIIVPDSAHGTNPASAAMAGFEVINTPSDDKGCIDLDALRAVVGPDTAGLMLTNPNTVGLFDPNIVEVTKIIHEAGGLCYYDGANLNAAMGIARPADMGFDVMHLNLHKTFATPHGGGGPGSGPVGCREDLVKFLPGYRPVEGNDGMLHMEAGSDSYGRMRAFNGNFLVIVKALTYVKMLGCDGLLEASRNAVLNANYMRVKLSDILPAAYDVTCMHEFVISLNDLKKSTGVSALDFAKALQEYGIHPPTMYFPMIVHEALMIEPTETESKETLDEAIHAIREIYERSYHETEWMHGCPHTDSDWLHEYVPEDTGAADRLEKAVTTVIGRPDEVTAARHPKLTYQG
jgi:glycine dehydrogenase subunit 2